jgi:hypothetical protein
LSFVHCYRTVLRPAQNTKHNRILDIHPVTPSRSGGFCWCLLAVALETVNQDVCPFARVDRRILRIIIWYDGPWPPTEGDEDAHPFWEDVYDDG